ncbi:D-alanyl-D-alanine carboxypeptidase [Streptomyces beigongshangae]|uniref:D-alanyl-D-alanine carboxypeptidase n=1 Tax=Streptomyces beigongshangae TaxID=2841597 RepID=UPI001C849224|nr:D-alanyl-D-alanine carboxypeptidase [Streptomyces sp. REN17]
MAGESPDRSKQHESSAEPTSGSRAPVPDPRLAVAREAVTAAARVDTATAVFSTGRSAGPAESEGLGKTAGSVGSVGSAEGAAGSEVAAEPAGSVESAESAGAEGAAAGDFPRSDGSAEPESAAGGAEKGAGRGAARLRGTAAAPAATADEEAPEGASAGADEDAAPKRAPKSEAEAAGAGAGADAGSDAAGGTSGSDAGTDADVDADAGTDVETDAAAHSDSEPEPEDAAPGADADADSSAGRKPEPASAEAVEDEPRDAAPADASPEDAVPEADTTSDAGTRPKPSVDQATAIFKRPPVVDQPTAMLKLGDAKPAAEDGKDSGPAENLATDKGDAAKPGVTKPGGAAVVEPAAETTVQPAAEPEPESKPGAESGPEPESKPGPGPEPEVERTSRFVALKPLDEPAPPKAKPAVPPASETAVVPQIGPERTTQQPLPPRPPLDLLAELTNTPPPRQTPVRTLVRRVKIWTPLVLLLIVVFAVVQAVRPLPAPTLALTADGTYAFEGDKASLPWPDEGQGWMDVNGIGTVDSFGEQKPVAIGSVAKAMTAYVILKEHPMKAGEDGAKIEVDAKAEKEGGYDAQGESTLNTIKKGDTLTQKDAIAAIMIPSANNVARLLARWDANGSEAEFVDKMNAAAEDLGMKDTKYTDPSGLKETTVSTAEDQVKLGNELVRIQALVDITKLPSWVDPSGKKWDNYNRLVPYNNAIGIKTGSTTKAGGNLLFAATQEVGGENVIVVGAVLGQHTPPIIDTVNAVSKTAMIAAQEALTSRKILKKGDVVGYVDDGLGGRTPVVATKDVSAVGWAGQTVKLQLDEGGKTVPHEAGAGTVVGSLSVGDGTEGDAVEVPVALRSDLAEPGLGAKLTRVS